jgi:hypothetical protein
VRARNQVAIFLVLATFALLDSSGLAGRTESSHVGFYRQLISAEKIEKFGNVWDANRKYLL